MAWTSVTTIWFSAALTLAVAPPPSLVIVGGALLESSSRIVMVACCGLDSVPLVTVPMSTMIVSSGSSKLSGRAVTVIVPVRLPGGITICVLGAR